MSLQQWIHAPIAVEFVDGSPMAIVQWITQGYGDTLPDGGTWLRPGCWIRPTNRPELVERKLAVIFADRAAIRSWRFVAPAEIPTDRTYRNAWMDTGTSVQHDMTKARALHRNMLRNERVERMLVLDQEWMAATRANDRAAIVDIDRRKQELLDITDDPRIDAATTTEELKQITLPARE